MATTGYDLRFAVETSFLLLIFSLGFTQPYIATRGGTVPITDFVFLLTGSIWFFAIIFRRIALRFDKIYLLFGLYAAGLLLSAIFSENRALSLIRYLGEVYLIGLAVMTYNLVSSRAMFKKVVIVWLAASTVTALIGVFTVAFYYIGITNIITEFALHHYGSLPLGNYPRIQSTFLYPSLLCNYLTVGLMLLFAAHRLEWIRLTLTLALSILFTVTIVFTVTPGIGGVLLAISLWICHICKNRGLVTRSKLVLAGGIISAIGFLAVSTLTLISTPTSPYYISFGAVRVDPTQRLLAWQGAFRTFLEHPFLGKGLGLGVADVSFMAPSGQMQILTDAHNTVLSVAGQSGIAGLIPLIFICMVVIRRAYTTSLEPAATAVIRRCLLLAFIAAFIYQGLIGSFENTRHLWVLIGLILAVSEINFDPTSLETP